MAHEAMEYFEVLGRRIHERWRSVGFDDRAISSIAEEELVRTPAHLHVAPDDVLEWCNRPGFDLPAQADLEARFGDPPVTVFRAQQMVIDVNFWIDSSIAIHEHSLDGAFQVLSGSSMHTQYDFVEKTRYNSLMPTPRKARVRSYSTQSRSASRNGLFRGGQRKGADEVTPRAMTVDAQRWLP